MKELKNTVDEWNEYCDEIEDGDSFIHEMREFNEVFGGTSPLEIAEILANSAEFNWMAPYFVNYGDFVQSIADMEELKEAVDLEAMEKYETRRA